MLVLAYHTGLRVSELTGLDVVDVSVDGQPRSLLHLPASIAKGRHSRLVPLNETAQRAIVALLSFNTRRGFSVAPHAPLLVTRKHTRLSARAVQLRVAELRQLAGLDVQATPHSFRHAFGSRIAEKTGNLRVVQQLLGHQRLNTSQIYVYVSRSLCKAVEKLAAPRPD